MTAEETRTLPDETVRFEIPSLRRWDFIGNPVSVFRQAGLVPNVQDVRSAKPSESVRVPLGPPASFRKIALELFQALKAPVCAHFGSTNPSFRPISEPENSSVRAEFPAHSLRATRGDGFPAIRELAGNFQTRGSGRCPRVQGLVEISNS